MMSSLSIAITLRKSGDRVCPGLYFREDRVVRVGRDAEPVPGEVDEVQLPVGVVALEGRGVGVFLRVVDDRSAVRGRKVGVCHEEGDALRHSINVLIVKER